MILVCLPPRGLRLKIYTVYNHENCCLSSLIDQWTPLPDFFLSNNNVQQCKFDVLTLFQGADGYETGGLHSLQDAFCDPAFYLRHVPAFPATVELI